jgi:hypothetical protein
MSVTAGCAHSDEQKAVPDHSLTALARHRAGDLLLWVRRLLHQPCAIPGRWCIAEILHALLLATKLYFVLAATLRVTLAATIAADCSGG